jgi:hypothetical protein
MAVWYWCQSVVCVRPEGPERRRQRRESNSRSAAWRIARSVFGVNRGSIIDRCETRCSTLYGPVGDATCALYTCDRTSPQHQCFPSPVFIAPTGLRFLRHEQSPTGVTGQAWLTSRVVLSFFVSKALNQHCSSYPSAPVLPQQRPHPSRLCTWTAAATTHVSRSATRVLSLSTCLESEEE